MTRGVEPTGRPPIRHQRGCSDMLREVIRDALTLVVMIALVILLCCAAWLGATDKLRLHPHPVAEVGRVIGDRQGQSPSSQPNCAGRRGPAARRPGSRRAAVTSIVGCW